MFALVQALDERLRVKVVMMNGDGRVRLVHVNAVHVACRGGGGGEAACVIRLRRGHERLEAVHIHIAARLVPQLVHFKVGRRVGPRLAWTTHVQAHLGFFGIFKSQVQK